MAEERLKCFVNGDTECAETAATAPGLHRLLKPLIELRERISSEIPLAQRGQAVLSAKISERHGSRF
jgi:hypothetical protein